jgi:hypothetical protein
VLPAEDSFMPIREASMCGVGKLRYSWLSMKKESPPPKRGKNRFVQAAVNNLNAQ